jgi:hypothetical protein
LSSVSVAAGSGLPPEVADRLENAISSDESNEFVGSYRITITSLVQKPNGKSREESLIEADVIHCGDGTTQRSLLKYIEDSADVTEKKRTKFESEEGGREKDDDLFVSHLVTDGLAKVLLLKREFHVEIRFDDISPAAKHAESAD